MKPDANLPDEPEHSESSKSSFLDRDSEESENAPVPNKVIGEVSEVCSIACKNVTLNKNSKFTSDVCDEFVFFSEREKILIESVSWVLDTDFKVNQNQSDNLNNRRSSGEKDKKIATLKAYLTDYFTLLKSTKNTLVKVRSHRDAELSLITKVFDRLRQELDSRERLLKLQ